MLETELSRHLDLDVVRFHAQHQSIILDGDDGSDDAALVETVLPFCRPASIFWVCLRWRCMGRNSRNRKCQKSEGWARNPSRELGDADCRTDSEPRLNQMGITRLQAEAERAHLK